VGGQEPRPAWVQALRFPLSVWSAWVRTVAAGLDPGVARREAARMEAAGAGLTPQARKARRALRRGALPGDGRRPR
jgi:hypothetical protein